MAATSASGVKTKKPKKQILTREVRLQRVRTAIVNNPELNNLKYRNRPVWGRGNIVPEILFIKCSPTLAESRVGIAMYGEEPIYRDLLRSVGLDKDQAYFTHMVKYRPLNGREPRPYEVGHSLGHIDAEVEVLKPKFVVTLGVTVTTAFLKGIKMSDARGYAHIFDDAIIIPIFDPEIIKIDPRNRADIIKDFSAIREVI